jgi:hypothetical protein
MGDDLQDIARPDTGRRRANGVVAVIAVVLALVGGFVMGRASSDDEADLFATSADATADAGANGGGETESGGGGVLDYLGDPLDLVTQRTTSEDIELIVRAGDLNVGEVGCVPDRVVRVGVLADDALVGTVLAETHAPGVATPGLIRLTGLAEGRPILVAIIRASEGTVTARFPNGSVDTADVEGGLAVVAAFAEPDLPPDALLASSIELTEAPVGAPAVIDGTLPYPECIETRPPIEEPAEEEKPALPAPGEQPADATAEDQVRAAFIGAFDGTTSQDEKAQFIERPEVWRDANQQLLDGPYGDVKVRAEVDEVVFTDPDHASVRYQLDSSDDRVPRYQIGDAVLIDGRWLVAITTPCDLLELASVHCDMSL